MTTAHDITTGYRLREARRLALALRREAARPSLVARPQALALLARGVKRLARPLALTLGPGNVYVLNERNRRECEVLADASTIARRVIGLAERADNLGAMLLRKMALELHERFGDGVATAAVMVRAMLGEAERLMAAGAAAPAVARGLQLGVEAVAAALERQARPLSTPAEAYALALGVSGDEEVSAALERMYEVLGPAATVVTTEMPQRGLDYEYIRGGKWDGYIPARLLLPEGEAALILQQPWIVLADEELTTVEQVRPMLELVLAEAEARAGAEAARPPLLVVARAIAGEALTLLTANHLRGVLTIGMLVLSSGATLVNEDLAVMAALTGGVPLSPLLGTQCRSIRAEHCGRAQRAVLTANGVTIVGGCGRPAALQQRIAEVRARLQRAERGKQSEWEFLRLRLARLSGGIGVLKIGAASEQELEIKKEQVGKVLRALEAAGAGGLLPGGGVALLKCLPALAPLRASLGEGDECHGLALVEAALTAPFLQIVRNHGGVHPPLALDHVLRLHAQGGAEADDGFDALRGDYASMWERRILDGCSILQGALRAAASLTAMLITTDALVLQG